MRIPARSGLLQEPRQQGSVLALFGHNYAQTRSRVLEGKKVASADKVLSLFEPHTRAIPRHKGGDEVEGGIVTRYRILEQPNEHGQAVEAVSHHRQVFDHAPRLVAGDRGVHSADTEENLTPAGVKLVAIPAAGKLSEARQALERTRSFKRGYRWRAGIEGRIASLGGLWLAQEWLPWAWWHGTQARPGGHGQQSAPDCLGQVSRTSREGKLLLPYHCSLAINLL